MSKPKVAIGWCHPQNVSGFFMDSVLGVLIQDFATEQIINGRFISNRCGPLLDSGRNQLVQGFLEHPDEPEWLLMVDADMIFTYRDVLDIVAAADPKKAPVVGGLCFAGNARGITPVLLLIDKELGMRPVMDYPRDAMVKCDATGGAFVLIHRDVFIHMRTAMNSGEAEYDNPAPWFAYSYLGRYPFGEDVTFFVRLMKLGIPLHVHTGIKIGHLKERVLDEREYDRELALADELGRSVVEADNIRRLVGAAPAQLKKEAV